METFLFAIAALSGVALAVAWVSHDPRLVFWLAFLAPFLPIAYIDRYFVSLPSGVKWLPFFGMAFAGVAAFFLLPRRERAVPFELSVAYGVLLAISVASVAVNGVSLASLLVAQRGYVILFCSIWAVHSACRRYGTDRVLSFLVAMGLISCVASVLQRLIVVPFAPGPDPGDRVTGLFSVGFIALFFHLFCVVVVLSYTLVKRRLLPGSPWFVLAVLTVGIAVGNQKASIVYLALAVMTTVLLVRSPRSNALRRGAVLAGSAVAVVVAASVFALIYNQSYDRREDESVLLRLSDESYVERYLFGDSDAMRTPSGRLLRGGAVLFAWDLIATDPIHVLLGRGPGATSESGVPGATGPIASRYPGYAVDRVALGMVLAETGLLGVAAQILFLLAILRSVRAEGDLPEHRAIRRVFVVLAVAYWVYANLYYEPIFALLVAALVGQPAAEPLPRIARLAPEATCASA